MNPIPFFLPNSVSKTLRVFLFAALSSVAYAAPISGPAPTRAVLTESIKPIAGAAKLAASDLDQAIEFMVPLRMRNYEELIARIGKGETIAPAEMAARYYPVQSDFDAVSQWLTDQGFSITQRDPNRLAIFASARIDQLRNSLQVEFGRVTAGNREFISAITAPSIPAELAPSILGINGLQPQIQLHRHSHIGPPQQNRFAGAIAPMSPQVANAPPFLVSEIMKAYNANGLNVTGANEKIAIVIDTFPDTADLTAFWATNAVNQSLANMEFVQAAPGVLPPPSGEETLDVEWASGIASGAKVRVYATTDLSFTNVDKAFQAIINDIPTQSQMHEVSISLGAGEGDVGATQLQTDAQYFATMAANGLSVFVSSGDSGSTESGITQVSYFASDPNVTAVGGTSLVLSNCSGVAINETVWNNFTGATGGGISGFFARPAWQVGTGVPAGNTRVVPDVASVGDPLTGALVILGGQQEQVGGTSWSAPTWAGFGALINQARANAALPPAGLLGPRVYPLLGTTAFRDITVGNNGAYSAGTGYDLATGLGVPNVATLLGPLTGGPLPPAAPLPPSATPYGQVLTPDSTCPLSSSTVTFTWSAGTATAYIFTIGSTLGASDIFNSGQTGGHSATVTSLPTDGRNIYVRLWSNVAGTWYNPPQDYVYQALPAAVAPVLFAPSSGTYKKKVTVNMATTTSGATIYYTTNGATPTTASTKFTHTFTITKKGTTTVKAFAVKSGVPDSFVTSASYTIR
jgi:kumamolisin